MSAANRRYDRAGRLLEEAREARARELAEHAKERATLDRFCSLLGPRFYCDSEDSVLDPDAHADMLRDVIATGRIALGWDPSRCGLDVLQELVARSVRRGS